ncbi:hypothetical protein TWF281_006964 [Arthrobotrys megalospora]
MAPPLLTLPNEILNEIICLLVPEFDDEAKFSSHKEWRTSSHQRDLCHIILTCKHLSALAQPHLYNTIVLDYHTNMTFLLRTLIEHPEDRGLIHTLSIQCPLTWCDTLADPYSPRETFLDDNPELKRKLDMKWDPENWDDFAAKVFRKVGLDADEFKAFTEDELEALNDNSYWMAIPSWSERVGYENALMQGMTLALIALSTRLERLCLLQYHGGGRTYDFEVGAKALAEDEELKDKVLASLKRLEFRGGDGWAARGYYTELSNLPRIKELVENGDHVEKDDMEFWVAKAR